jgi:hypothetical protein
VSTTITATGICPACEETVRIRKAGVLYVHEKPYDPDGPIVGTITEDGVVWHTACAGSGQQPAVVLELTFARWLYAHRGRRDWRHNPIAQLAQYAFGTRGGCGDRGPGEVDWTTAEQFHIARHRLPTGAGPDKTSCDWVCQFIEQAAEEYAAFLAAVPN